MSLLSEHSRFCCVIYFGLLIRRLLCGGFSRDVSSIPAVGSRPFRQCGTSAVAVDNRFGKTGSRFGSTTAETVAPNVLHRHRRYSPYTCTAETLTPINTYKTCEQLLDRSSIVQLTIHRNRVYGEPVYTENWHHTS